MAKFYPQNGYVLFADQSLHALSKKTIFSTPEIERIVNLDTVRIVFPPDYWKIYWLCTSNKNEKSYHWKPLGTNFGGPGNCKYGDWGDQADSGQAGC